MDPLNHISPDSEKQRYLCHNNDVNDPRYQRFVLPVVDKIKNNFNPADSGLDFGSGTGPVIYKLLTDSGYKLTAYDPFFCDDPDALKEKYDYVVCCEVIEHFKNPADEFRLLRSLLNPHGRLICMTHIYNEGIDFKRWRYKEDPTHVFFYHRETLEWIKRNYDFNLLTIEERLIEYRVSG